MKFSSYVVAGLFTLLVAGGAYSDNKRSAEAFIDAFYSYDPALLASVMDAGEEGDRILYYQAWAEAANYKIKKRKPCFEKKTLDQMFGNQSIPLGKFG